MGGLIIKAVAALPTLKKHKKPNLAALIGCLFGCVGLGLYFRSFIDFLFPIAAFSVLFVAPKALGSGLALPGLLGQAALLGVYGFFRAQDSNRRLATQVPLPVPTPMPA